MILCVCTQAKGADFFNADWILTQYTFQGGERQSEKSGDRPLRDDDAVGKQPHLMGGWRIGKDGFCAALYQENLKVILGDLECAVEIVNGSLIEVRAEHPYAAMRCSTVMRLRKVDPQNRTDLIGRSQTSCKNSRGAFSFSAAVAYMRDGSPRLVPFAAEERKRRQRAQEESARAEREKLSMLQPFVGTYERVSVNNTNRKACSYKEVNTSIFKIELGSNSDALVHRTISRKVEYQGDSECARLAELLSSSGNQIEDSDDKFALKERGVLVGRFECECGDGYDGRAEIRWLSSNDLKVTYLEDGSWSIIKRVGP